MMDDSDRDMLELIGFLPPIGRDSKALILLKAILGLSTDKGSPLTFADIYEAYSQESEGEKTSKAWVHRLLKELIDHRLVEVEDSTAKRYRYICHANTIHDGLSHIRQQRLIEIDQDISQLEDEKNRVQSTDIHRLANDLIEAWTGEQQLPTSRFLKGIDEFHRVTNETIYYAAKKGDIIRTSVGSAEPFMGNFPPRFKRVFDVAAKGIDVRYAVPPVNLKEMDVIYDGQAELNVVLQIFQTLGEDHGTGPGLKIRINPAGPKSHQFVSLNNEILALWISEAPPTAAWITRDFNSDLIDDIVHTFDEQWKKAYPIRDALKEALQARKVIEQGE